MGAVELASGCLNRYLYPLTANRGTGRCNKKLVVAEGRLTGAVLIGDVTDALWYLELIRSSEPIARIRPDMMFGRSLALSPKAA